MALVATRNDQHNHSGGFSSGPEDPEKMDTREHYPRRGGGYRGGRRGTRPVDNIHYGSRYVNRTRNRDDENQPPARRRSYSDGHGMDSGHDEAAGGDRRGGAGGYERRRPRAFGGGFEQNGPYGPGRGGFRYNGYRGGFQPRRRFRDDEEERYHQQQRPAPFRSLRNRDPSSDAQRSENDKDISCTMLPPHEFTKHFYSVKISNLPANKSIKGLYHHYKCYGKVLNIYVLPDEKADETKTSEKHEGDVESDKTTSATEQNGPREGEEHATKNGEDDKTTDGHQQQEPTEEAEKSQAVIISFDTLRASRIVERERRLVFGRKLQVTRFIPEHLAKKERAPPTTAATEGGETGKQHGGGGEEKSSAPRHSKRRSRESPSEKQHNIGRFSEDILVHMFGLMDMKTRGKASSVCRLWHRAMQKVGVPAPDLPADLKVVIQKADYETHQRQVVLQTLDKETSTLTVSYRRVSRMFDTSLERHVERLARQLAPAVQQIVLRKVAVSEHLLVTLGAFQNVAGITFEECYTVGRVDLGLLLSFFTHFAPKLSFSPRFEPLPPPSFSSRAKRYPNQSSQQRRWAGSGGAKDKSPKETGAKTASDAEQATENVAPAPVE